MSFQPILPTGGLAGWRFLQATQGRQEEAHRRSPAVDRAADHFRANIAKATTAEALVGDRRLLEVALGAFGLGADLDSRAFVRKVLEGGTLDPASLANKLSDKRYAAFAEAFGYGNGAPRVGRPGFADGIVARYERQAFQEAVGRVDGSMRLALNLGPALGAIVGRTANVNAQWYSIMGEPPLREVIQTALGLPKSFGALDVDRQLVVFKERARAVFGTDKPAELLGPERQERVTRLFLLRADAQAGGASPAAAVLQLLRRR